MKNKILLTILVLSLFGNGYFIFTSFGRDQAGQKMNNQIATFRQNEKTAEFFKMFVDNVLKSKTEVDFETRLKLENAVREINDKRVFDAWQRFINSQTEADAQENVKEVLASLSDRLLAKE